MTDMQSGVGMRGIDPFLHGEDKFPDNQKPQEDTELSRLKHAAYCASVLQKQIEECIKALDDRPKR